jgi:hypothetical protein
MEMAQDAYQEVVARNPAYVEWIADYPHLGGSIDGLTPVGNA